MSLAATGPEAAMRLAARLTALAGSVRAAPAAVVGFRGTRAVES